MKQTAIIGHFGLGHNLLNGQTIKTKMLADELQKHIEITKVDTYGGLKTYCRLPFQLFSVLKNTKNVIILPAHNGIKIIAPLLFIENLFFNRKLHYDVIGGWLPSMLKKYPLLRECLKHFDTIFVETSNMKNALVEQGFNNIKIVPNFKNLKALNPDEIQEYKRPPYSFCTFTRVLKEKGIEDAVYAISQVNQKYGKTVCTLDIYGQIDSEQIQWFENIKKDFPEFIHYCGEVPFGESVEVLKKYFAMLFPTLFYTEGVPGSIIDAYASGLPVISSEWESFNDVIEKDITGIGYPFNNREALVETLVNVIDCPDIINNMRKNCLEESKKYLPENAIKKILDCLDL